jgi:hypothetical protein
MREESPSVTQLDIHEGRLHSPIGEGEIGIRRCSEHESCLLVFVARVHMVGDPFDGVKWGAPTHVVLTTHSWSAPIEGHQFQLVPDGTKVLARRQA